MGVQANLEKIEANILATCDRVKRNPQDITIIGVTKYVTTERAEEAINAGITHLGENRMEGLHAKREALADREAKWHFIGSLQSRKVKDVINEVDFIHSLDRKSLAKEINKRASHVIPCFVQVNISGEESKHGLKPEDVFMFLDDIKDYKNIKVIGLMTMAPHVKDEAIIRKTFQELKALRDKVRDQSLKHAPCNYLSMGMSNDYHIAIEEGATHIRIGSKLVGSNK